MKSSVKQRALALLAQKRAVIEARHPRLKRLPPATKSPPPPMTVSRDSTAIVLGRNERGVAYALDEQPRLEHMHVIGATGSGKTNFLEHMIRQDIARGRGVCVVDPHGNHPGSLYRSLLTWLTQKGYTKSRTIHLIDPNAPTHTVGFNPLERHDTETQWSVIAEAMFEAFERMWGDEDGNTKPTIQRVLTATFTALGEQGLTLVEARLLFDPDDAKGIRSLVLAKLQDSYAYDEIEWLHRISSEKSGRRDFRAEVIGPLNRIAKLVRTEAVRAIVGQTERLIDLREVLDEGHIILANLSGGTQVYEQGADLLGRLLTRFLFFNARRRQRPEIPFFLYLDECHRYLSGDVPNMLAEVRKYGMGVVLAHQWLAQLGRADDPIREAVCKGPNLRAIFRIKDPREAAELAEMAIPLDLEMPVEKLIKPTVVGHRRTLFRSESSARHAATNWAVGKSLTDSEADSVTESIAHTVGESVTESVSNSLSQTVGESISDTSANTIGASAAAGSSVTNTAGSSSGTGSSTAAVKTPPAGLFDRGTMTSTTTGASAARSVDRGSARSENQVSGSNTAIMRGSARGRSKSSATGTTTGTAVTQSTATTVGTSVGRTVGRSVGETTTEGQTLGTSQTEGYTEGIEPLYANLPSAVHGKDNVLYMAAQTLRSLTTGKAVLNYVGSEGMQVAMITVPRVKTASVSAEQFDQMRGKVFADSPSALETRQAITHLKDREQGLIGAAAMLRRSPPEPQEPISFRVAAKRIPSRRSHGEP